MTEHAPNGGEHKDKLHDGKASNKKEANAKPKAIQRPHAGFLRMQYALLVPGIALLLYMPCGALLKTGTTCPEKQLEEEPKLLARFNDPFQPQLTKRLAQLKPHVFIAGMIVPAACVAIILSTMFTVWRRLSKQLQARSEQQDTKSNNSAETPESPDKSDNIIAAKADTTNSACSCTCCCVVPLLRRGSPQDNKGQSRPKRWWCLPRALRVILWYWPGHETDRRATRPQWLLWATSFVGGYSMVGYLVVTVDSSATGYIVGAGIGTLLVSITFTAILQYLQIIYLRRYRFEQSVNIDHALAGIVIAGLVIFMVQLFMWCFFVSYSFATVPCVPTFATGDNRMDTRYVDALIDNRFWGTVCFCFHLLCMYLWWLLALGTGQTSVARILRGQTSRTSLITAVLVAFANLTGVAMLATVFSEQPLLMFTENAVDNVKPSLVDPLVNAFFSCWSLAVMVMFGSIAFKKFKARGENKKFQVFLSYRQGGDNQLASSLYTGLTFQSRDYLQLSQPLSVFLDVVELKGGEKFIEGFLEALKTTDVYVPILSSWQTRREKANEAGEFCEPGGSLGTLGKREEDNVLLEFIVAYELKRAGEIAAIFPIFSGGLNASGSVYNDITQNCSLDIPDEPLEKTNQKALDYLQYIVGKDRLDFDKPQSYWTPKQMVERLLEKAEGGFVAPAKTQSHDVHRTAIEAVMNCYAKHTPTNKR